VLAASRLRMTGGLALVSLHWSGLHACWVWRGAPVATWHSPSFPRLLICPATCACLPLPAVLMPLRALPLPCLLSRCCSKHTVQYRDGDVEELELHKVGLLVLHAMTATMYCRVYCM
jgi:hypothetical protein